MRVRAALQTLASAGTGLRCKDLLRTLRKLGFDVRDGAKQGHKVLTHPGLARFTAAGFTCGHGTNPEIKPVYVKQVAKLLRDYQAELEDYLRKVDLRE